MSNEGTKGLIANVMKAMFVPSQQNVVGRWCRESVVLLLMLNCVIVGGHYKQHDAALVCACEMKMRKTDA